MLRPAILLGEDRREISSAAFAFGGRRIGSKRKGGVMYLSRLSCS